MYYGDAACCVVCIFSMREKMFDAIADHVYYAFAKTKSARFIADLLPREYFLDANGLVKNLPPFMRGYEELLGVHVGGCVLGGEWDKEHSAHAHIQGWGTGYICMPSMEQFFTETTLIHELAHVLSKRGHTLNWAREYVRLDNGKHKWLTVDWLKRKYKFRTRKKVVKGTV